MWCITTRGFYSVVRDRDNKDHFLVRSRNEIDLHRLYLDYPIISTPFADYPYRMSVPVAKWSIVMQKLVEELTYDNFKDNFPLASPRHKIYFDVWMTLQQLEAPRELIERFEDEIHPVDDVKKRMKNARRRAARARAKIAKLRKKER